MSELHQSGSTDGEEKFLSGAYQRILRTTVVISIAALIAATVFLGWRTACGVAIGAAVAYLNLRWLHHGTEMMVERMLSPAGASKTRLLLAFLGRLAFVFAIAYVIFKCSQHALYGFLGALSIPVATAMCEAIYEAFMSRSTSEISS